MHRSLPGCPFSLATSSSALPFTSLELFHSAFSIVLEKTTLGTRFMNRRFRLSPSAKTTPCLGRSHDRRAACRSTSPVRRRTAPAPRPNRVMPIDVPALPTLEEAVEGDEIPHDEFSQASHASFVGQRVSILDVAARPRPSPIGRVVVSHRLCFGAARRLSSSYEMAPSSQPSYVPRSSNSIEARFSSPIAAYEALGPRLTLATPSFSSSAMGGRPFRTMTLIGNRSARTNAAIDSAAVRPIG